MLSTRLRSRRVTRSDPRQRDERQQVDNETEKICEQARVCGRELEHGGLILRLVQGWRARVALAESTEGANGMGVHFVCR